MSSVSRKVSWLSLEGSDGMKIPVRLQEAKGTPRKTIEVDIDVTCLSDMAQQLPRRIIMHEGRYYGYHAMTPGHPAIFRERTVICV